MRTYALVIATAAFFALPLQRSRRMLSQIEPGYQGRSAYGGECRQLRKACLHKEDLGEQGQGNCERYRRRCVRD